MPDLKEYLSALELKLEISHYHYEAVLSYHRTPPKDWQKNTPIIAEFIAMMSTLHTCLDILAQCINLITEGKPEAVVSFRRLSLKTIIDVPLKEKIRTLLKDSEYLNDFVNVNKHRKIIEAEEEDFFISPGMIITLLYVVPFSRNNSNHPQEELISLTE